MNHVEGNFRGIRNANIFYQGWVPDEKVKAVILIIHGLGEHCGRYMNVVNHFIPLGFAVYGLDHLGHGKSDGEREVVKTFDDFTTNLSSYYSMVKTWQPSHPIFLLGHSMGGLIVSYYLLDHQSDFKGAIISAPSVKIPSNITPLTVWMGKILSAVAPKAGILSLDPTGLSRDQEVVKAYINDPLVFHGKTPARLAAEMLNAMSRVKQAVKKISLPLIIIQGSADRLVDPGGAQMLFTEASSKEKTLKLYEGYYHEVLNEPDKARVLKDLETWVKTNL